MSDEQLFDPLPDDPGGPAMDATRAQTVLEGFEVDGWRGVYVLGCIDRRVTIYSQQVRALNLAAAVMASARVQPGEPVVVVGAGAAGLTCAAGLRRLGATVIVLEAQDKILPLFRGGSSRWLHPGVYDWPLPDWQLDRAGLPLLDWEHGSVDAVRQQMEAGWATASDEDVVRLGVSRVRLGSAGDERRTVTWRPQGTQRTKTVILAVGFGFEQTLLPNEGRYWEGDDLDASRVDGKRRRWLVSGCGDGALTDLFRLCLEGFRHDQMLRDFTRDSRMAGIRAEIQQIEADAAIQDDAQKLHDAYAALDVPWVVDAMKERRRRDEVTLAAPTADFLTRGASPLNRFLASQLRRAEMFELAASRVEHVKLEGAEVVVRFADQSTEHFDRVVRRHGPKPALDEHFPEIAKAIAGDRSYRRAKPTLTDQTRARLWRQGVFGAERRGGQAHPAGESSAGGGSGTPAPQEVRDSKIPGGEAAIAAAAAARYPDNPAFSRHRDETVNADARNLQALGPALVVDFTSQRDLSFALSGTSMGPADVEACPPLAEVEDVLKALDEYSVVALAGDSGSGKSISAYHAGFRLAGQGRTVFRFLGPELFAEVTSSFTETTPSLLIVDDAHLLSPQMVGALSDLASPGTYVLFVGLDPIPGRLRPLRMNDERNVQMLAEFFSARSEELLPLLQKIDSHVGERSGHTSMESILQEAAEAMRPWQYMFILGRGHLRVRRALESLRHADDAHAALFEIAAWQLASHDAGVPRSRLDTMGRSEQWFSDAIEAGRRQGLILEVRKLLMTPHPRVASTVIAHTVRELWPTAEVRSFIRRLLADRRLPLRGRTWLLSELNWGDIRLGARALEEGVWESLRQEALASTPGPEVTTAAWMVHTAFRTGLKDCVREVMDAPTWLLKWIHQDHATAGYALAQIVNDVGNHDRQSHQTLVAAIDPARLGKKLHESTPEQFGQTTDLLDRVLQRAPEAWRSELLESIDFESLGRRFRTWPPDHLYEVVDFIIDLLWLSLDRAEQMLDDLLPSIARAFHDDIARTWSHLHNIIDLGLGFSPIFDESPAPRSLEIAGKILSQIDGGNLAATISTSRIRDWEWLGRLVSCIRVAAPDVGVEASTRVTFDFLADKARPLFESMPHDLEMLLVALCLDDRQPSEDFIAGFRRKLRKVSLRPLLIAPDAAIEALASGRAVLTLNLAGGLPNWNHATAVIQILVEHAPSLVETLLSDLSHNLADGLLLHQANSGGGCAEFLEMAREHAPRFLAAACASVDPSQARAQWKDRVTGKDEERRAALAVARIVADLPGPARTVAREILAASTEIEDESP